MQGLTPAKEYTSAAEMRAGHSAIRARLLKPANAYRKPAPVINLVEPAPPPSPPRRAWNVRYDSHITAWKFHDYKARIKSLEVSLRDREQLIERMTGSDTEPPRPRISADVVVKATLAKCAAAGDGNYTLSEILAERRSRAVVKVRHQCMADVVDTCYHLSYPQIGRFFNRDHTTILSAARKMGVAR